MYCIDINEPKNIEMYQYDQGNIIIFNKDIKDFTQLHFECDGKTDTQQIKNNQALVPYSMTKIGQSIKCYFYVVTENNAKTKFQFTILIKKRPEPNQEITPEERNTFLLEIKDVLDKTEAIAEKIQERADNGEFNGEKGEKGDKGDKGDVGPQGEQGPQGEKGDAYIITDEDYKAIAENVIDDSGVSASKTWSSRKMSNELALKASNKNVTDYAYSKKEVDNNIIDAVKNKADKENWQFLGSQDFASGEQLNLTIDFDGIKYKKLWIVIAYTSFSATTQPIHLVVGGELRSFTYTHTSKWMYRFLLEDKIEANEVNRKSNITMERSLGAANVYALQQGMPLIEDLTEIKIYTPSTVTFTDSTTVYVYGEEA